ncbi:MAG: response regulator [Vicinamibacterales bacterium]
MVSAHSRNLRPRRLRPYRLHEPGVTGRRAGPHESPRARRRRRSCAICWSLCETLSDRGYTVAEAEDGKGAMRALTDGGDLPDVVLLDFRLPDSNDLSLLSNIVNLLPGRRVILMTVYGTPELASAALERGAFRVLHKPFEMHDLSALVG